MGAELDRQARETGLADPTRHGWVDLSRDAVLALVGWDAGPGVGFTYHGPDGRPVGVHRVRLHAPVETSDGKVIRYVQPAGTGCLAYFPVGHGVEWQANHPFVVVTEGEKKADAVCARGYPCVGLGGVDSWVDDKKQLLASLASLAARAQSVVICFDSDRATNPAVLRAEHRLADALFRAGCKDVRVAQIPVPRKGKLGVDDYVRGLSLATGSKKIGALLSEATQVDGDAMFPKVFATSEEAVLALNQRAALLPNGRVALRPAGSQFFMRPLAARVAAQFVPEIRFVGQDARGKEKQIHVYDAWLRHPLARRAEGELCSRRFAPGFSTVNDVTYVNTYTPCPIFEPPRSQDVDSHVAPWMTLLGMQLGREADLLVAPFAAQMQGKRPIWACVLTGTGGEGKGLFGALMHRVFNWRLGYSGMLNAKSAETPRFFESGCRGRMLVRIEDVEDRKVYEILKTQADRESSKEAKGVDAEDSPNDALILITTNKAERIPLDIDADVRRWAVFQFQKNLVSAGQHKLIAQLDALLDDPKTVDVWRAYLQHFAWRKLIDLTNAPETQFRVILRDENRRGPEVIADKLLEGTDLPVVFTVDEFALLFNGRNDSHFSNAACSAMLRARLGKSVERLCDGGQLRLRGQKERWWVHGPDRQKLKNDKAAAEKLLTK